MSHDHDHDHETPSGPALRAEALEALLLERGLLDPAEVDAVIANYGERVGPLNGARVVARAWTDAAYRQRLLSDGTAAAAELGIVGGPGGQMERLVVVENGPAVHNVVVCTLCSCYPLGALGLAAALVQGSSLSVARGSRASCGPSRVRSGSAGGEGPAGLGFLG